MQRFAGAMLFLLVGTGWGQTPIAANSAGSDAGLRAALPAVPSAIVRPAAVAVVPAKQPKWFDRSTSIWMVASFGATVADIESTRHGITACGMTEVNPLFGRSPSRQRMYAIALPVTAGYNVLGMWLRRREPQRRWWMVVPASMTGIHGAAAAHNFAACH